MSIYPRLRYGLLGLLLLVGPLTAAAQEFDLRTWENDLEVIESTILDPLSATLSSGSAAAGWHDYIRPFLDKLRETRDQLDPKTYQIMSNAMLALDEDFTRFAGQNTWQDAEGYVKTKIDFANTLIALVMNAP